ncbi:MAG: hypothetical protein ACYCQM_06075, partial [Acidithiobacillus sp.]
RLPRLLPAGATVAGRDSHPLKDRAFARRTHKQRYVYLAIMYSSYVGVAEYIVNTGLAVDVVPR